MLKLGADMTEWEKRTIDTEFTTIIGKGDRFYGDIRGKGNLKVEGVVIGDIDIKGIVFIDINAVVEGDIKAKDITIAGQVKGNVNIKRRAEVFGSARLYGEIYSKFLFIDEGVKGKFNVDAGKKQTHTFIERRRVYIPDKKKG
ncbi:MAG TPA: polymer-forming cytoskeletal protein [Firmicutes bacterium]|nr:polymer-forming cytoskeletal protein [Bacillota bacterium]